jgi:hypothetical protein
MSISNPQIDPELEAHYNDLIKREILLVRENPIRFVLKHCITIDEHDRVTPFKNFPEKDYIIEVIRRWHKSDRILIPKSRQMMITWLMMALHLWYALSPGQKVLILSKDETTANDLIEKRVIPMLDKLPPYLQVKYEWKPSKGELLFPALNSEIKAFSSSDRSTRSYTASAFFFDEMAHLDNVEEIWKAIKPTVDGGGKFTGVSTPNGQEYFYKLLFDKEGLPDKEDIYLIEEAHYNRKEIIRGLWEQHNANGFDAIWLYYYADPDKDPERNGLKWYRKARRGFTKKDWEQEYEISFLHSGLEPIYPGFQQDIHIAKSRLSCIEGKPLFIGWDFGYRVQAVVLCQMDDQDRLMVLRELTGNNVDTYTWCSEVARYIATNFPNITQHFSFCDDAGRQKYETSDQSSFDILIAYGFTPISSKKPIMFGVNLIRRLLAIRPDNTPGLYIDPSCETLIDGFKTGYHRPKTGEDKPVKDGLYDHYMDALRYVVQNYIPNPTDSIYMVGKRHLPLPSPDDEYAELYQSATGY